MGNTTTNSSRYIIVTLSKYLPSDNNRLKAQIGPIPNYNFEYKKYCKTSPGKTTLRLSFYGYRTLSLSVAENLESIYLDLENNLDLVKVKDIATFHEENSGELVILDEVQRLPEIFQQLRGILDNERRKGNRTGQFLFLGSASIDLIQQSGESLAGQSDP